MEPQRLLETKRFSVERVERRLPDGRVHQRAVVRHPGAVAIIPMVDEDHVCLIRNYRDSVAETLIEIPAGTLEPPEPPEAAARRELQEETGYRADVLEEIHSFLLSPGILDERMYVFAATGLTEIGAAREVGEEIENLVVPWDEALRMVADRTIQDAKTIAGLLLYDRRRRHA